MLARLQLQERFEASELGRILISAWLIVTIVVVVAINVPSDSYLREKILSFGKPYLNAVGLDQNWRVFAADPRHVSLDLRARVSYADGTSGVWRLPRGSAVLGNYWDYRWRKWMENAVQESRRDQLWRPAALFVARQERRRGRRPVKVTLIRRTRPLYPPGAPGPDRGRWEARPYYTLRLGGDR